MKNSGEQEATKRYHSNSLKFLMASVVFFICFNTYGQETMHFDSEAKKLEFIRQMLIKEKYFSLSEVSPPHCRQIMEDFLSNKNFKAIEPVVRADSIDDPGMAKWRQCERKDYHDYGVDPERFFSWLEDLGAPPYRYYRIDLDGNKANGPEDMIYCNTPSDRNKRGETGYTWVDLSNCEVKKGGFTVTGALERRHSHPNATFLNSLVYYKGELWAADFVGGFDFSLMRWLDRERMETCRWLLFKPKEIVK